MEALIKESTENTPGIILEHTKHSLEFLGESRPEDVKKFFGPVFAWLTEYKNYVYFIAGSSTGAVQVTCNFKLEYFNSSSAKIFLDILNVLKDICGDGSNAKLVINWYYDEPDEDMRDAGEEFEKMVGVKFNLIQN